MYPKLENDDLNKLIARLFAVKEEDDFKGFSNSERNTQRLQFFNAVAPKPQMPNMSLFPGCYAVFTKGMNNGIDQPKIFLSKKDAKKFRDAIKTNQTFDKVSKIIRL